MSYSGNDASDLFQQFNSSDPAYTLYYPDGTAADALNRGGPDQFGNDLPDDFGATVHKQTGMQDPLADKSVPPPGFDFWAWMAAEDAKFQQGIDTIAKQTGQNDHPFPWITVGLIVAAVIFVPMVLNSGRR